MKMQQRKERKKRKKEKELIRTTKFTLSQEGLSTMTNNFHHA